MKRISALLVFLLACIPFAQAHFIFVVPEPGFTKAQVFISETLTPDGEVGLAMIAGTKLSLRDSSGTTTQLTLAKLDKTFEVALSGTGNRVVYGITDLGLMTRGEKSHVLLYYPKSIIGDAFDASSAVGGQTPVEIIPVGKAGETKLKLLARGKPQADAEITVILPDGNQKKLKTDASGQTETLTQRGRFGAWARYWEAHPGERDGKKYEEVRHYATLVFDAGSGDAAFANLPEATSSFGAVELAGQLYVYGGHIAPTHRYWKEGVSGRFHRANLASPEKWDQLPSGPPLQGMNLAAYSGQVYRIGGMAPHNEKGQPTDNRSTADCARFNATSGTWEALPALPEPRSSHDVTVVGSKLMVAGGWNLQGDKQEWVDTLLVMDLASSKPEWKTVPQPFRRRALIVAGFQDKLYVLGGFDDKNRIVTTVSIYDPRTNEWKEGPSLPEKVAFAPAAVVHQGSLYVSVSDGTLLRLNDSGTGWDKVGKSTPRVAHRMVSYKDSVLVIGGAAAGKNFDLVEAIRPASGSGN